MKCFVLQSEDQSTLFLSSSHNETWYLDAICVYSDILSHQVEVKRTVPREDMHTQVKVVRTKKIFVGGIPLSLTEGNNTNPS